jgi:hypothetical protein
MKRVDTKPAKDKEVRYVDKQPPPPTNGSSNTVPFYLKLKGSPPATMMKKRALCRGRSGELNRRLLVVFRTELVAEVSSIRRAPRLYVTINQQEWLLTERAVGRRAANEGWIRCPADGAHDRPPIRRRNSSVANSRSSVAPFEKL